MVTDNASAAVARDGSNDGQHRPVPYTALFQPNRLDLIVHLRALIELSDTPWPTTGGDDTGWLARSDAFATEDGEPSIVRMGVDADFDMAAMPAVGFGSGGGLVRGVTAAAVGIHAGTELQRTAVSGTAPRRRQEELRAAGYSTTQLRALARVWLHFDDSSAVAVIDLSDEAAAAAALHELRCRYSEFHTELDHLSTADCTAVGLAGHSIGSVQVVCVSGLKDSFDDVVGRHDAIVATGRRSSAQTLVHRLFDDGRTRSTSPAHQQRVRRQRRREVTGQLVDRVRGR